MRISSRFLSLAGLSTAALLLAAACSSAAATPEATVLAATATPTAVPSAMDTTTPVTSAAAAAFTIGTANNATLGDWLTGDSGATLYVFTADTADTSTCSGSCATNWPALTVPAGTTITPPTGATGAFSLITRADGTMQVAYNHMPLYYFKGDAAAGDTKGQGIGGKWFVAPLSGTLPAPAAATPKPTQPAGY